MNGRQTSQLMVCAGAIASICTQNAIAHQGHQSQPQPAEKSPRPTEVEATPSLPSEPAIDVSPVPEPSTATLVTPPTQMSPMPVLGESIFALLIASPFLLFALRRRLYCTRH